MFALKGPKMKTGEKGYDTNFPLEHAQKDVRFAQALGDELGISISVSSAANGKCLFLLCVSINQIKSFFSYANLHNTTIHTFTSQNATKLQKALG